MDSNRLKMTSKKTKLILFGSAKMLPHCYTNSININGERVSKVPVIKYLGAWIDADLTIKDHISVKCKSSMFDFPDSN